VCAVFKSRLPTRWSGWANRRRATQLWPVGLRQESVDIHEREVMKRDTAIGATNIYLIPGVSPSELGPMNVVYVSLEAMADGLRACFASRACIIN